MTSTHAQRALPRRNEHARPLRRDQLTIRPATPEDCHELAPHVRDADRMEIAAASGGTPLASLMQGLALSAVSRAIVNPAGEVIAIYGAAEIAGFAGKVGLPWLVSSDALFEHRREILRRTTRAIAEDFSSAFPVLYGVADVRNATHLRWIKRAGFVPGRVFPLGVNGELFQSFSKRLRADV